MDIKWFLLSIIKLKTYTNTYQNVHLGGRCGICGEVYNEPKKFEKGGSLYRGIIVRNYVQGQNIDVAVEVTANHKGFFEFRICDIDGLNTDATQACLDKTPLTDKNGNTRFPLLTESATVVSLKLKLPSKLTCKNCVIQVDTLKNILSL